MIRDMHYGSLEAASKEKEMSSDSAKPWNQALIWSRIVAGGSAIAYGVSWGGFGGVGVLMQEEMGMSTTHVSLLTSIMYVLIPIGALCGGDVGDARGRLTVITWSYVGIAAGLLIMAAGTGGWTVLFGRLIESLATGFGLAATSTYITELAPAQVRGYFTALEETFISAGILLGYLINMVFASTLHGWRYCLIADASIPIIMIIPILLGVCPESPRYYQMTSQTAKAEEVLHQLVSMEEASMIIERWSAEDRKSKFVGWTRILWPTSQESRLLRTAMCVMAIQMLSGISWLGIYTVRIFDTDMTVGHAMLSQIVVGVVRLAGSLAALLLVEQAGRRMLLLVSSLGMGLGYAIATAGYFLEADILLKVAFLSFIALAYEVGVGPVAYVYTAEILPTELRSKGFAMAVAISRLISAGQQMIFPMIADELGNGVCMFSLSSIMAASTLYIFNACPETQGIELEDMREIF
mmetsp:Transcript_53077/g.124345  ORF Transcript_53077/g.124345 Transcript_53077/m.124345 type:complete len:466 (+) Transcript_53077:107-1504(+)